MNIADIEKFVPCGHPRAKMIFDTIRKNVELSGLENLDYNLVLTKRVVEFLGLDIDEMDKYGW
jgi:hypothetical protein